MKRGKEKFSAQSKRERERERMIITISSGVVASGEFFPIHPGFEKRAVRL